MYYSGIKMNVFMYHETEDEEVICLKSLGVLESVLKGDIGGQLGETWLE